MKAKIITCHNIKNYGSVYQTFATQELVRSFGLETEIIDYRRPGTDHKDFRKKCLSESHVAKNKYFGKLVPLILKPSFIKMEKVFETFLNNHIIRTKKIYYSNDELKELDYADIYITGSDQVWNTDINGCIEYPYFLDFAPNDKKRIAISSSFGKDNLSIEEKKEMYPLLKKYSYISTREQSGVALLNEMGISNAFASIDPTLIVDKSLWYNLKKPIKTPTNYILVYQLHRNKDFDSYIKTISKYYNIPCLRVELYYHYILKGERIIVSPSPEQLLTLINNADFILSDSFHMSVFSIIFHKKFGSIYSKNAFNGRIENLLNIAGLQSRKIYTESSYETLNESIDYSIVDEKIEIKRKEALNWIKSALLE